MNLDHHRHRARRPAAGLVTVVLAIGAVTQLFGLEAGLLTVVLAIVALVVAPHVYLPWSPTHGLDASPDRLPTTTDRRPLDEIPLFTGFPSPEEHQDPDSDRRTR